ncbi:hypothetical protein MIT9_P2626 [Methylomarinovum caldicuralii]|uniref:Uncharacterized protein n=2 Tax=Methylomarinovum caldicuralii TaxID=438856 RepID=A0AAU9C2P1_9GAMM|nr:hypothetical protein MIT9_P2626 [Methylomarinovum caldicuralii]
MAKTLKGELQQALKTGDAAQAIGVCSHKAPKIARAAGQRYGLVIDRTSLKPRRRLPDAWKNGYCRNSSAVRPTGNQ